MGLGTLLAVLLAVAALDYSVRKEESLVHGIIAKLESKSKSFKEFSSRGNA